MSMDNDVRGKHREVFTPPNLVILQVKRVSKYFGDLKAVNEVSFEVEKREIFGIAGPNGAGKTTLFNVIAGKLKGSGEIIFDGINISGLAPHQICHKGITRTFQIPRLFSTMSVFENVKVGAHFGSLKVHSKYSEEENIKEVINFVGLEGKENAVTESLDLFDKKLTMLAAALATKPKLVLLDEPIGGLSPMEIKQFIKLIQKLNEGLGLTIIIIEHLMHILVEISHRLMILHNGQKVCIGPSKEVIKDSKVREVYLGESYA